jgi:hypothetical protein
MVSVPNPESARGSARVAMASVFLAPTRAFQEIARGAGWFWPWIVTSVMMLVGMVLSQPLQDALTEQRLSQLNEAQREAAAAHSGAMKIGQYINMGVAPLFLLVGLALSALVFVGFLRSRGLTFKAAMRGLAYAGLIGTGLGQIVSGIAIQLKARSSGISSMDDMPRLGLDLLGGHGLLRGVLSAFNVFTIWWFVVLVFGFAVLTNRKPGAIAAPTILAGGIWLVLMGLLGGLFIKLAGG